MYKKFKDKKGFTLIELMAAIVVFAIFTGTFITTYLQLAKGLRQVNVNRKVYVEARDVLERINVDIRSNTVDYDYYSGGELSDGETEILVLKSADGISRILYKQDASNLKLLKQKFVNGLWQDDTGFEGNNWRNLLGENVVLDSVKFLILPFSNPAISDMDINQVYQPTVTVLLALKRDALNYNLQSTVTSRIYLKESDFSL